MNEPIERNGYVLAWIGGSCPIQAEGLIDGHPLYFRARGSQWSLTIGIDDGREPPLFGYLEEWGKWPDAGYMAEEVALEMIDKAVGIYREREPTPVSRGDADWPRHVMIAWSEGRLDTRNAMGCLDLDEYELEALAASMSLEVGPLHAEYKRAVALLDAVNRDTDPVREDVQRDHKVGPDHDPGYFAKLDGLLEREFGPVSDI
jgi:hypothetical protein